MSLTHQDIVRPVTHPKTVLLMWWEPALGFLAAGGISFALPPSLSLGPRWLLLALVFLLLTPSILTHRQGRHSLSRLFGLLSNAVITISLAGSIARLVISLPSKKELPITLLFSALLLWCANILIFSLWYWRLDGGGPVARRKHVPYGSQAFLFPQLQIDRTERKAMGAENWIPRYVDYLFMAFNSSTAFSPSDTMVLAPWAKLLMMIQTLNSMLILVVLVAHGIGAL